MKLSFKDFLIEQDITTFQQYLQKAGLTFPQLLQQLKAGKPSGSGGNADFYRIPNTEFGVRVVHRGFKPDPDPNQELTAAHDPFDGENLGQPVAHYGNNIQVLRLQHGTPAGMPFRWNKPDGVGREAGVETFQKQLLAAAQIPIEEYERLMKLIISLNNKGYAVDPSKSGNLLINAEHGKFNLVDLNKQAKQDTYQNSADDIVVMLMNNYEFNNHLKQDPAMRQAARQIIQKVQSAAKTSGLDIKQSSSFTYSQELSTDTNQTQSSSPAVQNSEAW